MILGDSSFAKLVRDPDYMRNCLAIIIDEVHCISQWGDNFRKLYAQLAALRSCVARTVPFLAASATLPPPVLSDVKTRLDFVSSRMFMINLGNDRRNITPLVLRLKGAADDLPALNFLVYEALAGDSLVKCIIFFNKRQLAYYAHEHLRRLFPADSSYRQQIDFLHAARSPRAKRRGLQRFRDGEVKILCATEAAGMVGPLLAV